MSSLTLNMYARLRCETRLRLGTRPITGPATAEERVSNDSVHCISGLRIWVSSLSSPTTEAQKDARCNDTSVSFLSPRYYLLFVRKSKHQEERKVFEVGNSCSNRNPELDFSRCCLLSLSSMSIFQIQTSRQKKADSDRRRPPNTLPLVGNGILFLQARHRLFSWFVKCEQQYGFETLQISVPSLPPGVLINDPKNLDYVFKNEGIFAKGDFFKSRSWDLFGTVFLILLDWAHD